MIEAVELTKRFGDKTAVDRVSFTAEPGTVTGFLGPNGAGKSTTMRMIMGLDRPTGGSVRVNGRAYRDLGAPLCEVGALLDAKGMHGSRSARAHLTQLAVSNGIPTTRVGEVLEMTGLTSVARKQVKGFSLGMGQRLGIAAAMLGDPGVLVLDEPVNGLDPEGVKWVRETCRALAAQGRTVFISSHLMSEMAQTADQLLVIARGRILARGPVGEIIAQATSDVVRVVSPQADTLAQALASRGVETSSPSPGTLTTTAAPAHVVGEVAAAAGVTLHELTTQHASLEEAYLTLTSDETEYATGQAAAPSSPARRQAPATA